MEEEAAWQDVFACLHPKGRASAPVEAAMRKVLAPARPARRWGWAAAAAVLLLASALALREREEQKPSPVPKPMVLPSHSAEAQILPAPGSAMSRQDGLQVLQRGACWILADGEEVRVRAGGLLVRLREGEAILREHFRPAAAWWLSEALAGEGGFEVAVLSGEAEVVVDGKTLSLQGGEAAAEDGTRRPLAPEEPARLREAVLALGRDGEGRTLDGRAGQASWLLQPSSDSYRAALRFRAQEAATFGLCFLVDGRPTLWTPEGKLADGGWHSLHLLVSADWVMVVVDGGAPRRVRRREFKPNPVAGLSGVGPAVWGGRLEVASFTLEALE